MALALSLFPDLDSCPRLKVRTYEADMNYSNNYTIRDKLYQSHLIYARNGRALPVLLVF